MWFSVKDTAFQRQILVRSNLVCRNRKDGHLRKLVLYTRPVTRV